MDYFAGLDVSVKDTSVCIVDDTGRIIREVKVASEPGALLQVLRAAPTASSGLGWKPDPCRSGFTALWVKRTCQSFVLRPETCEPSCRRRSTRPIATMPVALRR